ncbi:hypothetical protein N7513_000009 [Penicillium frequentans]|nr:hypothetical protein N7513_004676 [Penicillium glabrum]KAJ5563767.1 hypothetical protein N7513_000009 [Penicillium glabrum]
MIGIRNGARLIATPSNRHLFYTKSNSYRLAIIAALARDTLSFPAIGVGIKRLFNTTRDICYYRRGR